jgi:hypothetical protein
MAGPSLALGEPLLSQGSPIKVGRVGKLLGLSLVIGMICAAFWYSQQPAVESAEDMAVVTQPMQRSMAQQAMQTRSFRQSMQRMPAVQASRSPIEGFLDVVVPEKEGEVEIIAPMTKRDMMAAAAAMAVASSPFAAQAAGPVNNLSPEMRKKLCASNPTSKACLVGSALPPK